MLLPTRSATSFVVAEVKPSVVLEVTPSSAPPPQLSEVTHPTFCCSQIKRGAKLRVERLADVFCPSSAKRNSGRNISVPVETSPASRLSVLSTKP